MPHYSTFTLLDITGEKSTFQFNHGAITATSIAGFLTEIGDLRSATEAIT